MSSSLPSLHAMDLRFWLRDYPRCTKAAVAALAKIVEGQPAEAIARVAPDQDFLERPQHLAALAKAGYLFNTLTVPETEVDRRLKSHARRIVGSEPLTGELVRKHAIYINAPESVHTLLDESGVPPVPKKEAGRWGADIVRGSWLNSLLHVQRLYPEEVERWVNQSMVFSSMAVETWVKNSKRPGAAKIVSLAVKWGLPVDKFRDHIQKTYPAKIEDFEVLVAKGRAMRMEELAPQTSAPKPARL